MSGRLLKVLLLAVVASCLLFLPPMLGMGGAEQTETTRGILLLAEPVFAHEEITFIEEEAGISAWIKLERQIDLGRAATAFRIVERQTDEYIIGFVGLPGLDEDHDVHVFVHRDGLVLAYYLEAAPVTKIIDWGNPAVTKLEQAVNMIGAAAAVPMGEVEYYHFGYPAAEKLTIITDRDSFKFKIPGTFVVYEGSYSFWAHSECRWGSPFGGWLTIDERDIVYGSNRGDLKIGTLIQFTQLKLNVFQTVGIRYTAGYRRDCRIAIALVYAER